jgi:hypothetical protein
MPRDETKLHDLPDRFVTDRTASAGRGPSWLVTAGSQARWPSIAGSAGTTARNAS